MTNSFGFNFEVAILMQESTLILAAAIADWSFRRQNIDRFLGAADFY